MRKVFLLQLKSHSLECPPALDSSHPHEARDTLAHPRLSPGFPLAPSLRFLCNYLVRPFRFKATRPPQEDGLEALPGRDTCWRCSTRTPGHRHSLGEAAGNRSPEVTTALGSLWKEGVAPLFTPTPQPQPPSSTAAPASATPAPARRSTKTRELRNVPVERGLRSHTAKIQTERDECGYNPVLPSRPFPLFSGALWDPVDLKNHT